jgi:hypothetical protein
LPQFRCPFIGILQHIHGAVLGLGEAMPCCAQTCGGAEFLMEEPVDLAGDRLFAQIQAGRVTDLVLANEVA